MTKLSQRQIAALREEGRNLRRSFEAIGEFVFQFSQLEFTIKARLGAALALPDDLFDVVTAPYDFAVLCTVTSRVLEKEFPSAKAKITQTFNECRALNDQRVRVAHALWAFGPSGLVAKHV